MSDWSRIDLDCIRATTQIQYEREIVRARESREFSQDVSRRHVIEWLFIEYQLRRLHSRMRMEPSLHYSISEEICDRQQAHALMMSHPAAYQFITAQSRFAAGRIEIQGLVKSVTSDGSHAFQPAQILQRSGGVTFQGQKC